jgi:hypothetical protein
VTPRDRQQTFAPVAASALKRLAVAEALVRYGMAWPLLAARETLAGWDDLLQFWLNLILGDDSGTVWQFLPPVDSHQREPD